jgi:tRNA(Ile)-lysidine synthase
VAHLHHGLRGAAADADEQFVMELAERSGIPCVTRRVDVGAFAARSGLGIEAAARSVRYRFLEEVRAERGFDAVATAHTADDNAETVLLHLFRGTGIRGLAGIPVRRGPHIIRPLLFATRAEVEEFARSEGLESREDESNQDLRFTRNFVRHRILPEVRSRINQDIVKVLQRTSGIFRDLEDFLIRTADAALDSVITQRTGDGLHLAVPRLKSFPALVQEYIIMGAVERHAGIRPGSSGVVAVRDLLERQAGSWVDLGSGMGALRDRETIIFGRSDAEPESRAVVEPGGSCRFGEFLFESVPVGKDEVVLSKDPTVEYIDADAAGGGPFVLRTREDGDHLVPLGMEGTRKVSDLLIDAHIPRTAKHHHPVLVNAEGRILWLCGLRLDHRCRVTDQTTRVLRLRYLRTAEQTDDEEAQES